MSRTGERFGPYILVRQIALGGMAEIYLARSEGESGFEKYMALKMIHPHLSADRHFVQMLIEEAKITVYLNHSNIGHVFDLGRIDDTYYIAMEYVDGADLYRVMRNITERDVQMSPEISAYIMHEVCAGLDYAHRCRDQVGNPLRIIHRDISPQNILVSRAGEIKVVDFGIAKAALRVKQTEVGVIKGKYYYMSPEQAWGRPLDQRTDIFSAGVVLYETLAGQMLYLEEDVAKLLEMVRRADIPPLHLQRPDVPSELEAITMKAVARRPEDRWQTAHDFQMALQGFLYKFAPTFTPQRVQGLIAFALDGADDEETTSERTGNRATGRTGNERMSRQEFSSLFAHSIVFSDEVSAGEVNSPFLMDAEDDFADATVISGPPSFDGAPGEFEGDPSIPVLVSNVKDVVASGLDQVWDDDDEPTTLMVRDEPQGGVTDRDVMSSIDLESQWEATTAAQVPSKKGLHPSPPPLNNSGRPVGMVSVPEDGPGAGKGVPMSAGGQGIGQGWGQAPMPAGRPGQEPSMSAGGQGIGQGWGQAPMPAGRPGQAPSMSAGGQGIGQGWGQAPVASGMPFGGVVDDDLDPEEMALVQKGRRGLALLKIFVVLLLLGGGAGIAALFWPVGSSSLVGSVEIRTVPSGAVVVCDGERQPGVTPLVVKNLDVEKFHALFISKPGFEPVHRSIAVQSGRTIMIRVPLASVQGP